MDNKKMLLIIDAQYDFINGSLAVSGAEEKMNALAEFMNTHGSEYVCVAMTADWHPFNHCSFKDNGGIWPVHCVQHSHGASIFERVFEEGCKLNARIFTKGNLQNKEEYSVMDNDLSSEALLEMISDCHISEIDVAGLVFEFCVAGTVKDGVRLLPNVKFKIFKDFCPILDKKLADEFTKFIEENDRIELV